MVVRVFTVEVLKNPKKSIFRKSNAAFSCSNSELSATCGGFDRLGSFLSAALARAFLRSTYMLPWRILTRRCPYSTSICAIFGVLWTAPFPGCFTRYYNADCVISTASLGQLSSLLPLPRSSGLGADLLAEHYVLAGIHVSLWKAIAHSGT